MVKKFDTIRIFATPKSLEDMQAHLKKFSGSEAIVATTCAYMMYNLMAENFNNLVDLLDAQNVHNDHVPVESSEVSE